MRTRRNILVFAISISIVIAPVAAQVIVLDPANVAVNTEQVFLHALMIDKLAHQIRNQEEMLENWRFSRLDDLLSSMTTVRGTTEAVADVDLATTYSIASSDYAQRDAEAMMMLFRQWLESQRAAIVQTRTAQSGVVNEMSGTQDRIGDYVERSNRAAGQTSVIQAANETLASLAGQLQALQAIELTDIRVEMEAEAQRQAAATFHRQRRMHLTRDWSSNDAARTSGAAGVSSPFSNR